MGRTWIRQDVQIASSLFNDAATPYDDTIAPTLANYQTNTGAISDDLNNLRSQVHNVLDRNGASFPASGHWYDDIGTPGTFENGTPRGVSKLNQDLHDVQRKRILVSVTNLNILTVPAQAYATGTLSGTANFLNGETVTIGSTVYTFKTPWVDGTPYTVDCSVSLAATLQNLYDAINLTGTIGTQYGTGTLIHPTVTATSNTATSLVVRAKTRGTAGNTIATTDVTVGNMVWGSPTLISGAGDASILISPQLPTATTAAIGTVTTLGTVGAYNAAFGVNDPTVVVSGDNAVDPKNLCILEDATTHDPILSGGRVVYGLFQTESSVDGSTMDYVAHRAMLSYVRINVGGTALEAVPTVDIQGKTLHYASIQRKALEDLNEQDFLRGAVVDVGTGTATRQVAYDNQGILPVDLLTNALLDIGAGFYWTLRDNLEAALFTVTEGSGSSTSTVSVDVDTDLFKSWAAVNAFDKGIGVRTGGVEIDIGKTTIASTGTVETTGSNDLRLYGARALYLDDSYQAGSTWTGTNGVLLSSNLTEWSTYKTDFGEVSLLNALDKAYKGTVRHKKQATVTANVNANADVNGPIGANNVDVNLVPYNLVTAFVDDVEVYLNGELLRNAASAGSEDVYPGTSPTDGDLKFTFKLKGTGAKPDQITVIVTGQ